MLRGRIISRIDSRLQNALERIKHIHTVEGMTSHSQSPVNIVNDAKEVVRHRLKRELVQNRRDGVKPTVKNQQ